MGRIAAAGGVGAEDFDHADDGAEQAHQRRDHGDGADGGNVAGEIMRDGAARVFDHVAQLFTGQVAVTHHFGQHAAQRRIAFQPVDRFRCVLVIAQHIGDLIVQAARHHQASAQGQEALEDQRQAQHGCRQQGPDGPAGLAQNGKQSVNS